jgi:hypothetical protein
VNINIKPLWYLLNIGLEESQSFQLVDMLSEDLGCNPDKVRTLANFLTSMLVLDPTLGIPLSDLKNHRWFSESRIIDMTAPCISGKLMESGDEPN